MPKSNFLWRQSLTRIRIRIGLALRSRIRVRKDTNADPQHWTYNKHHVPIPYAVGYNEFDFFLENEEYRPFDGCNGNLRRIRKQRKILPFWYPYWIFFSLIAHAQETEKENLIL